MSRTLKPVIVEWTDSWADSEALDIAKAADLEALYTHSIGYLISDNKKGVTIAMDCYPGDKDLKDKIKNYAFIPKRMIIKIVYLTS